MKCVGFTMRQMNIVKIIMAVFIILAGMSVSAQPLATKDLRIYSISGRVVDEDTNEPMEYATVVLLRKSDSTQIDGIASGTDGYFNLEVKREGHYILQVGFIGFETDRREIILNKDKPKIELGAIRLHPRTEEMGEVVVKANEHAVEYKIDKKVVHVAEQYTAISGTAVDILENVPSVQVDIEGNLSLRGNSNFTVLIDDRPTVLDANDALQQIPAGMIKNIEIITNPSAKYDPEGTAGIINIITKKRTLQGLSGISHINLGLDEKYGGDFLLNFRSEKFNYFIGADYNNRNYPGFITEEKRTYGEDTTFYLNSDGDYQRQREAYSIRGGIEWFPNDKTVWSVSSRYGSRAYNRTSVTDYEQWNSAETDRYLYTSESDGGRSGDFLSINTEFSRQFSSKKHRLDLQLMLYQRQGDEESVNTLLDASDLITSSQKSLEGGPSEGLRYRINYVQPFSDALKIEAGAQGRVRSSEEWNELYYYNLASEEYELQPLFSHEAFYERNIHAGYGLVSGEYNKLGYQLGLRGEYTYRDITLQESNENFNIDRFDVFPSAHFSYQLPANHQLMASYSRRIDRPRGWYLEPFYTWSDAFNIRRGNPDLKPEYINSYELGYQKQFNSNSISLEVYYRSTENRIERIRSVYDENVMLQTYENVGTDYSLGTELMLNTNFTKWWESSLTGNFYNYRVKGEFNGTSFDKESFTYSLRWNQLFTVAENTRIELNPAYHSPEVEAQEREEGFFYISGAIRQSLMDNKLNLTLQVRDILSTGKHESVIEGDDFYNYRLYEHKAPIVMLNITWRINNYRNGNGRDRGNGGGDEMNMEGGME